MKYHQSLLYDKHKVASVTASYQWYISAGPLSVSSLHTTCDHSEFTMLCVTLKDYLITVVVLCTTGPADPMQPTNLRVTNPGDTTVTVQWTVPLIAYTPEIYVVSYSTGTLKRQVLMSDPVGSGADFDAVDQMFSVELTELEPNTAYNYQVMSQNSVTTTASAQQSLNTTAGKLFDIYFL